MALTLYEVNALVNQIMESARTQQVRRGQTYDFWIGKQWVLKNGSTIRFAPDADDPMRLPEGF